MANPTKKITVLGVSEVQTQRPDAARKYARVQLQIWTGQLAGAMMVYGDPEKKGEDLKDFPTGDYMVEIQERHGDYGLIEVVYANPVPVVKATQQPRPQAATL
jgi:hypothetical protein